MTRVVTRNTGTPNDENGRFYSQLKRALRKAQQVVGSHAASHEAGGSDALEIADLATSETDDTLVLAPDGAGGVEFRAETGGGGSFTPDFAMWLTDAPPVSAGAEDDEFDDAEGAGTPTGWTEIDHGGHQTVSEDAYGLKLFQATHAGDSVSGVYKAEPAGTDYTIWTKVSLSGVDANFVVGGLALYQDATNSGGDIITWTLHQNGTATSINLEVWSAYNSFAAGVVSRVITVDGGVTHMYLRIRKTNSSGVYQFDYSLDGQSWHEVYNNTISFDPAHFGLCMNNVASGSDVAARFPFFRYVASNVGLTGLMSGARVGMVYE